MNWIHTKKIRKRTLIEITLLGLIWGWSVFIFTQAYLNTRCSFFLLSFSKLHAPFFKGAFPLYSSSIFHHSLPLIDHIGDLLDAYPIKNLLEALWIAINLGLTVQVSSPHKCDQVVWCRTLMWWWQSSLQIFPPLLLATFLDVYPQKNSSLLYKISGIAKLHTPITLFEEARLLSNYCLPVMIFPYPRLIDPTAYQIFRSSLGSNMSLGTVHGSMLLLGLFILTLIIVNFYTMEQIHINRSFLKNNNSILV